MADLAIQGSTLGNALAELLSAEDIVLGSGPFYLYAYFRPEGPPFYIGKGKGRRWLQHERMKSHYNRHLGAIIRRAGGTVPKMKLVEGLTNEQAVRLEVALIRAVGRTPKGPLVNLTDGGEGALGYRHTETSKKVMSKKGRGRPKTVAHSNNIGTGLKGYFLGLTEEQRRARNERISAATREAMRAETVLQEVSASQKGRKHSSEHRKANSEALKAAHAANPEWGKSAVVAMGRSSKFKGRKHTAETKIKMSRSHLARSAQESQHGTA